METMEPVEASSLSVEETSLDDDVAKINGNNADEGDFEDAAEEEEDDDDDEMPRLMVEESKDMPEEESQDQQPENEEKDLSGGLVMLDMSKDIAKVDTDEDEDDGSNDINRNRGQKRKLSGDKSGDDGLGDASTPLAPKRPALADDPCISDSDLLIQKQTLGKGKRARIPNKRYSDIVVSPNHHSSRPTPPTRLVENGAEHQETEDKPPLLLPAEETPVKSSKVVRAPVDITNPLFLVPLDQGWKRELVWRAASDKNNKIAGDIYYYTPAGKKLRSMREVGEFVLDTDLSIDNFTFFKAPLGTNDPEKEIIRDAKKPQSMARKAALAKAGAEGGKAAKSPKTSSPKTPGPKSSKSSTPKVAKAETLGSESGKKSKGLGNFKIKAPSKGKSDKKSKNDNSKLGSELDSPIEATKTSSRKSSKWSKSDSPKNRSSKKLVNITNSSARDEPRFMANYLQNVSYAYNTLLYVFQYLKVQDLLRAGCVCVMWRDIANHSLLWRTVRMKNSQVHKFEGLANTLKKHGTVHLDLRKMLPPTGGDEIWPHFSTAIERVESLRKIDLCRCPASVVEKLALSNPNLEVINAVTIKCESMSLEPFSFLKNIKELRVKSTQGLVLTSSIAALKNLTTLTHLSLTSIRDLNTFDLSVLAELTKLESLDLGECTDFREEFGKEILSKLENLEKLRLEKGQGECHTFEMLDAVKDMPKLEQLELVNFDIKAGFDKALGACLNIKRLLIIPTYISQSATTNHMVLGGVLQLQKTLSHFVWGVTLELLRVTELFVDQCEVPERKEKKDKKKPGSGDSIPVLKPVPLLQDPENIPVAAHDPPQVEILPLPHLQKLLMQSLPSTRVKILKIPFHATWRQSISDTGS